MAMKSRRHCKMMARTVTQAALLFLAAYAHATPTISPGQCTLPLEWRDKWFHSGVGIPVVIDSRKISFRGVCIEADRDRYLLQDLHHDCFRCLVIHQQHYNVLQYKQTYCVDNKSLEYVCTLLTGDAQLHSMFRLNADPVPCPFPHTYTFTYVRGHAECAYPLSKVDSCTEDWRIVFRYQACPDIQGTESTTEELVCLAEWKEGSNRYLVVKSDHPLATTDEDRYQCFVYKMWKNRTSSGIEMAQSGDATCDGLYSVTGGSMTLMLKRVDTSRGMCRFPMWLGGPQWYSLDGFTVLHVTRGNSTMKLTSNSSSGPVTYSCQEPIAHSKFSSTYVTKFSATYVTRVTHGCTSGYQCLHMKARDEFILEIMKGLVTPVASAACSPLYFDAVSMNYTTFVSSIAESRQCPGMGRYEVLGSNSGRNPSAAASTSSHIGGGGGGGGGGGVITAGGGGGGGAASSSSSSSSSVVSSGDVILGRHTSECDGVSFTSLSVGCSTRDTLVISNRCSSVEYSCHGWWEEDGRQYLVVTPTSRSSKGVRRLCLVLDHGAALLSLASSTLSCRRDLTPGLHGHIALNTTNIGACGSSPPESGSPGIVVFSWLLLLLLLLLLASTLASPRFPVIFC